MILFFQQLVFTKPIVPLPMQCPDSPSLQNQQTFDASAKSKANRGGLALHYFRAVFKSALL